MFERCHVAAVLDDIEAAVRQVFGHALGLAEASQPILSTSDDQCRTGDAFEIGIAVAAHQCRLARSHLRSQPPLHAAQALEKDRIALAGGMEARGNAIGARRSVTRLEAPFAPLGLL